MFDPFRGFSFILRLGRSNLSRYHTLILQFPIYLELRGSNSTSYKILRSVSPARSPNILGCFVFPPQAKMCLETSKPEGYPKLQIAESGLAPKSKGLQQLATKKFPKKLLTTVDG